jgi:2-alkyl-3-oxoalkanoate reductase
MHDWLPYYARAIGAKPPRRVPRWLARILAGKMVAEMSTKLRGASNAKARRELGWRAERVLTHPVAVDQPTK